MASTEEILLRELKETVLTELNKVKKVLEKKYKLKYKKWKSSKQMRFMFLLMLAISVKRGLGEFYILKQRNVFE